MPKLKHKNRGFDFILNRKLLVIIFNWLNQGVRYMVIGEKVYTISLTLIPAYVLYFHGMSAVCSVLFAHTVNWVFNGQLVVLVRFLTNWQVMSLSKINRFLRVCRWFSQWSLLDDFLFTGSITTCRLKSTSDLDVRIYSSNPIKLPFCFVVATVLRFLALCLRFPLDIYCFSSWRFMGPEKIHPNERPLCLIGNEKVLEFYPDAKKIGDILNKLEVEKNN